MNEFVLLVESEMYCVSRDLLGNNEGTDLVEFCSMSLNLHS